MCLPRAYFEGEKGKNPYKVNLIFNMLIWPRRLKLYKYHCVKIKVSPPFFHFLKR